jgi:GntR family transcriptional regulator, rspAB operon transcriptional repressor
MITLQRPNLADQVYERLVAALVSGQLPAGSPLNVGDLAKELHVSPSPVRDALQRMASEGLVVAGPNRRTTVRLFTRREVEELFQVRELLECAAARLGAARVTPKEIKELRSAAEHCAKLFGDPAKKRQMLELDALFHQKVAEASGNLTLRDEIVRCQRRVRLMQCLLLHPEKTRSGYDEHMEVVDTLEKRDPARAEEAMRKHIRQALAYMVGE